MDFTAPPDPALYDDLRAKLAAGGPLAAVDDLCDRLRRDGDFQNLFYALLMRKRIELGVTPFPTGPAADLPPESHEPYEEAIRHAGRLVGTALLERGDIPKAWQFFRMLGEPEPVRAAIADYRPEPDADPYPIIEIAWQQGVLPQKGFDLVLDGSGVCSAITMASSVDLSQNPDLRAYCTKRLVRALNEQLTERLRADLAGRGVEPPAEAGVSELLAGHDELVADEAYHVDVSHLSSVVQLAMHLPPCPELNLARELCLYGEKLSPTLRGRDDPPFEDTYADYRRYLDVVAGSDVEAGLAHFRAKLPAAERDGYQYPVEVTVNLLLRADRLKDALAVARQYLAGADERHLSCPGVSELARRAGEFEVIADAAKAKADPVGYLAGLIAARK
jgi:hypothetical protein